MIAVGSKTLDFPNSRRVFIDSEGFHHFHGQYPHRWKQVLEALGNKSLITEWMYRYDGTGKARYQDLMTDTILMAVNDVLAFGAMPVVLSDLIAGASSGWFADEERISGFEAGVFENCQFHGMALVQGESQSASYIVNSLDDLEAPVLACSVTGLIAPSRRIVNKAALADGDLIIALPSSGVHANGLSLIIQKAMGLPDKFLTKLPSGKTLGDEVLTPTLSYLKAIEAMVKAEIEIHGLLPGTGDGLAKLASDKRNFTYWIHTWHTEFSPAIELMRSLGVSLQDLLSTFNCGGGYYVFVPEHERYDALFALRDAGFKAWEAGRVREGYRETFFQLSGGVILPPPGE